MFDISELDTKIENIYLKYIYYIPNDISETVKDSFDIYSLYDQNKDIREFIELLKENLESDISFKKKIESILVQDVVKSLTRITESLKSLFLIQNRLSNKDLISESIMHSIVYLKGIFFNIPKEDMEKIFLCLIKNNKHDEINKVISKQSLNIKNYYNKNLLAIYEETCLRDLKFVTKDNLYLIALLNDIIRVYSRQYFEFNGYNSELKKINFNLHYLETFLIKKEYDLKKEKEYTKYNLLEVTQNRVLLEDEPRIIDEKFNFSVNIKYVDINVYKFLYSLHKKTNFKLSFYPDIEHIYSFKNRYTLLLESKQFGVTPSISELKSRCSNKNVTFIDDLKLDTFWVKQHGRDFTIEEILNDFKIFENSIVTKVLHLQHYTENDKLYINHLDFEYIFYTIEEFSKREKNDKSYSKQIKGSAYPRQKIFKIDNAKLEFVTTIYPLAYNSFSNKQLVNEYFKDMGIIS